MFEKELTESNNNTPADYQKWRKKNNNKYRKHESITIFNVKDHNIQH